MSVEAYNYAVRVKVGNMLAKWVLTRLADRADERYSCFPSIGLLAAEAEKSERQVQRALSLLRDLRLVSDREGFRSDGSQTSSRYQLHGPWDDYAGTGVPFPEIVTPKQARAEMWAQAPAEGKFREGTAAYVALKGDAAEAEAAAQRAADAAARVEAVKRSQQARGRKAAAAKRGGTDGSKDSQTTAVKDVPAGEEGVTSMSSPPVTPVSPPPVSPMSPLEPSVPTLIGDDALAARSAGYARRASDRSSAREVESGCAASSNNQPTPTQEAPRQKAQPSSGKAKHTRQQLDLARAVHALFPADLLNGWTSPTTGQQTEPLRLVPTLTQAILDALAGDVPGADRTVQQLGARIQQRWNQHGYAEKFYAGEIAKPVGAAVAMVKPLKPGDRYGCANPRCEAGKDADTGQECHVCPERLAARKAERKRQDDVPAPRPPKERQQFRECPCGNPIAKDSDDTLCRACRLEADDAAETARLRAQIAAQYGTAEQREAYCGQAPF